MVLFFFFCLPGASSVIKTGWALRRAGRGEGEAGAETDKGRGAVPVSGAVPASPAAASCIPRDHRVCVLPAALAPLGASLAPRGAHVQGLSTLSFFFFFRAESLSSLVLYHSSEGLDVGCLVVGMWVPPRCSPALGPLRDTQQGDGTAWGGDLWGHSSVGGCGCPVTPSLEPADPQEEVCARRGAVGRGGQGRAAAQPPASWPAARFPLLSRVPWVGRRLRRCCQS